MIFVTEANSYSTGNATKSVQVMARLTDEADWNLIGGLEVGVRRKEKLGAPKGKHE